jgi:hypothetical protein
MGLGIANKGHLSGSVDHALIAALNAPLPQFPPLAAADAQPTAAYANTLTGVCHSEPENWIYVKLPTS